MTVSIHTALTHLLAYEKNAEIHTDPRSFFVHVRLPEHVAEQLRDAQKKVVTDTAHRVDVDHVTLCYTNKPSEDHPPVKIHAALEALRQIGQTTPPIEARVQGWGYFDSASKDGKPATALVALIDAPGLDRLHVDMARALETHGISPSDRHIFTAHATVAYLPQHGRVEGALPPLSGKFTIDKAHVAARDHHEIPLTGTEKSMGLKAASMDLGVEAAKFAVDFSPKSNFKLDPAAIRSQHREDPIGQGETSPGMGGVPMQTGAMHSGGGFK